MYTKQIPYKNFKDQPKNATVQFNLTIIETFKLLVEFQAIFAWRERMNSEVDVRALPSEEVIEFYNNLEAILLQGYGVMSEDGEHFRKGGRYDFEESAVFPAVMEMFLTDTQMANELVDGLMPKNMQELVAKADANLAALAKDPNATAELQAQIAKLQAEVDAARGGSAPNADAGPQI